MAHYRQQLLLLVLFISVSTVHGFAHKPAEWFAHPAIGSISFDQFDRTNHVVVHQGSDPYWWPVNCSLFMDPVSGDFYAYITQYFRGYWPVKDHPGRLNVIACRSTDQGESWKNLGVVLEGTAPFMSGGVADMHVIYDPEQKCYYGCFGWVTRANDDGGIAMAKAERPAGPFVPSDRALITREREQPLIHDLYKRIYAGSVVKRKTDYLVLAMASTPSNLGGTWSVASTRSSEPQQGYAPAELLFSPQQKEFFPPLMENFSVYTHKGWVYYPFTSLGGNRTFQLLMRAPLEKAHLREAYEVVKYGDGWHEINDPREFHGIWGQQPAYQVVGKNIYALYPTLSDQSVGAILFSKSPLRSAIGKKNSHKCGYITAAVSPTLTFLKEAYQDFSLSSNFSLEGEVTLFIGELGVLQIEGNSAGASPLKSSLGDHLALRFRNDTVALLRQQPPQSVLLAEQALPHGCKEHTLQITRQAGRIRILLDDLSPMEAIDPIATDQAIRFGVWSEPHSYLTLKEFTMKGKHNPQPLTFGASVAMLDGGFSDHVAQLSGKSWKAEAHGSYSLQKEKSYLKINFIGREIQLFFDKLPPQATAEAYLDGVPLGKLNTSSPHFKTQTGYHALFIEITDSSQKTMFNRFTVTE